MGYDNLQPLWKRLRPLFPVTQNLVYLNHAAVAPLVQPAADAMTAWASDACQYGSLHYDQWLDAYEGLRVATAALIHASPREIAIVKNTSEGIATVALGVDWKRGDTVVAFQEEFPANYFPWKRLERHGVTLRWLSVRDPLERIEEACRGARLLAISYVNYLDGHRVDLQAIGEICRRNGCIFFVDAIQGLGVFPLDVREAKIDALAADGHKWLFGPEGCGVLYIRQELQDQIEPVEFGWTNVARYADYASRDMTLRADAGRYECGTLNTISIFGLRAAVEFVNRTGVEEIASEVLARTAQIADGVRRKGYEVLGRETAEAYSGIVSFRKEGVDARMIVRNLRENGVIAAPRQGWVRTSPHCYISPEDVERVLSLL